MHDTTRRVRTGHASVHARTSVHGIYPALSLSLLPSSFFPPLRCLSLSLSPSPFPFPSLFPFITSSFSFSLEQVSAPPRQFAPRSSQRSLNERKPALPEGAAGEGNLRDSNSTSGELSSREQRDDALLRAVCSLSLSSARLCPFLLRVSSARTLSASQWFLIREMRDNPLSLT